VRQILVRIPVPIFDPITLYGYGAMLCIGFLLAILVAARRAKRLGQSPDIIYNAALVCFFGGLVGARLFYVIQYGENFRSVLDILKIWQGGLTFYGGFLLAAVGLVAYLALARMPIPYWFDIIAPSGALGLAFGRLGCFLNGCCYGDVTQGPLGIAWPEGTIPWLDYASRHLHALRLPPGLDGLSLGLSTDAAGGALMGSLLGTWPMPRIFPSQLMSFANAMLLFALLYCMFPRKRRHGQIMLAFILLYGVSRFMEECIRSDEPAIYLLGLPTLLEALGQHGAAESLVKLTISQNVAILMVIFGGAALAWLLRSRRRELQADYAPPPAIAPARTLPQAAKDERGKATRLRQGEARRRKDKGP
jgi:phosphatidylglycerol:prolipoprotein diacylglycerol transferase